jgi:hypothetical protein
LGIEMKSANPKLLRRHALMLTALLIAPVVAFDRAEAACTPASPASGTTVECSGDTGSNNVSAGYGLSGDNNNIYNIQAGATVTGGSIGVEFGTGATFNNSGTITGGDTGVHSGVGDVTVNNTGTGAITGGASVSKAPTSPSPATPVGSRVAFWASALQLMLMSPTPTS